MLSIQSAGLSSALYTQNVQRPTRDFSAQMKSDFTAALKSAGVDESEIPTLLEKIQEAVAGVTSTESSTDKGEAIKQAVQAVLKENGVDVDKFDAAMEALRPQGPPPPPPGGASSVDGNQQSLFQTDATDETEDSNQSLIELLLEQLNGNGSLFDATV
jgi:hypothetical protein